MAAHKFTEVEGPADFAWISLQGDISAACDETLKRRPAWAEAVSSSDGSVTFQTRNGWIARQLCAIARQGGARVSYLNTGGREDSTSIRMVVIDYGSSADFLEACSSGVIPMRDIKRPRKGAEGPKPGDGEQEGPKGKQEGPKGKQEGHKGKQEGPKGKQEAEEEPSLIPNRKR